ncbi:MAG: hypothetical protein Q4F05_15695 [bacterium]|nr:hypothetical protein [bacterium]
MTVLYWVLSFAYYALTGSIVYLYAKGYEGSWGAFIVVLSWVAIAAITLCPLVSLCRKERKLNLYSIADIILKMTNGVFIFYLLEKLGQQEIMLSIIIMAVCCVIDLIVTIVNYKKFIAYDISMKQSLKIRKYPTVKRSNNFIYYLYTSMCFTLYPETGKDSLEEFLLPMVLILITLLLVIRKVKMQCKELKDAYKMWGFFLALGVIGTALSYFKAVEGIRYLGVFLGLLLVERVINRLQNTRETSAK